MIAYIFIFVTYDLLNICRKFLIFIICDYRFEDYFVNRVKQMTYTFPEDAITSSGSPFWSAPKRFPRPLDFSKEDSSHINFVLAAAILRAETFAIPVPDWVKSPAKFAGAVDKVVVPDFMPRKDAKIVTDEKATSLSTASIDDAVVIDELVSKLESCKQKLPVGYKMNPIQFEKVSHVHPIFVVHPQICLFSQHYFPF